jgi:methionyl-tRNA formyltransferase
LTIDDDNNMMTKNKSDWKSLRIVFMGTPDFAVASLDKLVSEGANIVGVITAPDKPGGRGMQLQQSAVKKYAIEKELNILQPEKLRDANFLQELKKLEADLQVVVAFRMLPEVVWNMPPLGTINVHGSLLPDYRGAAPINWAIINGEKFTGVTTFRLKHEVDTGNILLTEKLPINDDESAGELHDKMKITGAELLLRTIKKIASGTVGEIAQAIGGNDKQAPKINKETGRINWNEPVEKIYNLIRGLAPNPGAFATIENKTIKIFKAGKIIETTGLTPGNLVTDSKTYLRFAAKDGYIDILELQQEGKKRMGVKDFLRGFHLKS